jgi:hypothetical protein
VRLEYWKGHRYFPSIEVSFVNEKAHLDAKLIIILEEEPVSMLLY